MLVKGWVIAKRIGKEYYLGKGKFELIRDYKQ